MHAQLNVAAAISSLMLIGCVSEGNVPTGAPTPHVAFAEAALRDANGNVVGDVVIDQLDQGIRLTLRARNMTPGVKAAHIHAIGRCDAPDFTSAGGHWNPFDREHGRDNPAGQHMGDMPNVIVGQEGTGLLEVTITGARIEGGNAALLDADGAAVMIHAGSDDYRSDPTGNAGGRIACGVIEAG